MEKRKNFVIGLLSGVCLTLMLFIVMGFDNTNRENKSLPLDKTGNIIVKLSDEDLNKISSNLVDDDYIIKRILFCLDGATISDGTFTTYCNK
jgi:hypothetical protein